jgi:hypothetical protein
LDISFICCETCIAFIWIEREGSTTRGIEKGAGRERERDKNRE